MDLPAGDCLTLTVGDAYCYANNMSSHTFPAGAEVYGYVDSFNNELDVAYRLVGKSRG